MDQYYAGMIFDKPVFMSYFKCTGCDHKVAEATDCPLAIKQCPVFGMEPDVEYVKSVVKSV